MKHTDRIRLHGARLNRMIGRFFIFIGMLALFSLALGGAAESSGVYLYGILLVIALSVGLVIWWVRGGDQRRRDRSHQLALEVLELCPYASHEEQTRLYRLRRRREMRLEALFYLLLAALAALWFWGMYAVDADPASWTIGLLVIAPAALVIALVLLIGSFLPMDRETMPAVSDLERRLARQEQPVRFDESAENFVGSLSRSDEYMTAQEYLARQRRSLGGTLAVALAALVFFALIPLALLGVGIYVVAAQGAPGWFLLLFGLLALVSVPLWAYMTHVSHTSPLRLTAGLIRLRSRKCRVCRDAVLSADFLGKAELAEIHFAKAGPVRCRCSKSDYDKYFEPQPEAAILQSYDGRIEAVTLLPEAAAEPESTDAPNILLLDEEELRRAAQQKLEQMPPEQRKQLETEIHEALDLSAYVAQKGYSNLTSAEQGLYHASSAAEMRRSTPDVDLSALEKQVMDRLQATRSDILRMKKNPFLSALFMRLLLTVLVGIGGVLGTALVERASGAELGFLYLVFSAITGLLALSCGELLLCVRRFRKLQKAYLDPQYQQKLLDAAVYRELREQVKESRGLR